MTSYAYPPVPLYLLLPLITWWVLIDGVLHYPRKIREWKKNRPVRPLCSTRKRALTLPLPESSSRGFHRQRTHDQLQSLLLTKVPYETRQCIYEYVLAPPEVIHVLSTAGRLHSVRCFDSRPTQPSRYHICIGRRGYDSEGVCYEKRAVHREPIYLVLLYTCRQIYSEAINILYSQNTLSIDGGLVFKELSHAMIPRRLASIRKMSISVFINDRIDLVTRSHRSRLVEYNTFREKDYQILHFMAASGLQNLEIRIHFYKGGPRWSMRDSEELKRRIKPTDDVLLSALKPLMDVRVPDFRVILHGWPQQKEDALRMLAVDPPFSLERYKPPEKT